jgi:hypothetical protein
MASDWYYDDAVLERIDWPLFGALVARMNRSATEHGAVFAAYLHPDLGATWDPVIEDTRKSIGTELGFDRYALERRVSAEVGARDVTFLPLVRHFAEQQHRGPFHLLPRDPHCNAEGYRLQAEILTDFVLQTVRERSFPD